MKLTRLTVPIAAALLAFSVNATAATAIWTGKSTFGQSVAGMPGFKCEYNYAGRSFWMFFPGGCQSSVEIQ